MIMHFYYCRICRTDKNLIYTAQQILQIVKKAAAETQQHNSTLLQADQLLSVTSNTTLGNICHECHEQLHNFHRLDEIDSIDGNGNGIDVDDVVSHEEVPVIVDDDDLLFNMFLQKISKQKQHQQHEQHQHQQTSLLKQTLVAATTTGTKLTNTATTTTNINLSTTPSPQQKKCDNYELNQHSLGSDGDTEVIEVLTSRESTPVPMTTCNKAQEVHNIVAIIDLDNDNEKPREICAVGPPKSQPQVAIKRASKCNEMPPVTRYGGRRKKSYAGRELRLIASLSLVSSDSECEEIIINAPVATSIAAANKQLQCKHCDVRLNSAASLSAHELSHVCVACPVCQVQFNATKRLINHLRCKHRCYDGDELSEQPRRAQDSAMTIRLRYLDRYTYYECQLCGRIDSCFKEHKQHIMDRHADESRSLKDPMMKTLRCPLCKEMCGTQQVALCAHLLAAHTEKERKGHIREVRSYTAFSCTTSKQQQINNTARVYQYCKRKTYFFKCKLCSRVAAGYVSHIQHLATHGSGSTGGCANGVGIRTGNAIKSKQKHIEPLSVKAATATTTAPTTRTTSTYKCSTATGVEEKQKQRLLRAVRKFKADGTPTSKTGKANTRRRRETRRRTNVLQKLSKMSSGLAAGTPVECPTRITVKVKSPLQQFPALMYCCRWCNMSFKGFYRLNQHHFRAHSHVDYYKPRTSKRQRKRTPPLAVQHTAAHTHSNDTMLNRCANQISQISCVNHDLTRQQLEQPKQQSQQQHDNDNNRMPMWLQELLDRNQSTNNIMNKNNNNNNTATDTATTCNISTATMPKTINGEHGGACVHLAPALLCTYCTHLFGSAIELRDHEMQHLQQQHAPIVKYMAI